MDVLGRSTDMEPVINLAKQIAAKEGNSTLVTWCSDAFCQAFTVAGATEKPLPIAIPANTGSPGLPAGEQKGKWWFMPGDTDYL